MAEETEQSAGGGSFITRKVGPLPMWAWMAIGLGVALAVSVWRNNRSASADAANAGTGALQEYKLPEGVQPTYTYLGGDSVTTVNVAPPGAGRPGGPSRPPVPTPVTPTTPTPTPTPGPAAPAGQWVTVTKWAKGQPKGTPSTLWGIAEKVYGSGSSWQAIWDAPQNAAVKAKRSKPELIQPGDKFWVPTK